MTFKIKNSIEEFEGRRNSELQINPKNPTQNKAWRRKIMANIEKSIGDTQNSENI